MIRTKIDIADEACRAVIERYGPRSKREAVNYALRRMAGEPLEVDAAQAMRGSGWKGDLEELRTSRKA